MATEPKIDFDVLNRLITEGKSTTEIAKYFSCTPGAVSQAKKKLKIAVVKNVALENAHKVVGKNIDAVQQLQKINEVANRLLNELTGEDQVINRMASAIEAILSPEGDPREVKRLVRQISQDKETAIKACAEIRNQMKLQLEIFQTLYDIEAMAEFQREVLNAIGEVSPDVRNRITQRLKESRALRSAVSIN